MTANVLLDLINGGENSFVQLQYLDSFAPDLLDYRAIGSGIVRALQAYPDIDFINEVEADQFTVIIHRKH